MYQNNIVLKAIVFEQISESGKNFVTLIASVPKEQYGTVALPPVGKRPASCGVYISMKANHLMPFPPLNGCYPLTRITQFVSNNGYRFVGSVQEAKGKNIADAFFIANCFVHGCIAIKH